MFIIAPQGISAIVHFNGTLGVNRSELSRVVRFQSLLIDNLSLVNSIFVSFDAGATYKTILPNAVLTLTAQPNSVIWVDHVYLRASGPNTAYECLMMVTGGEWEPPTTMTDAEKYGVAVGPHDP